MGNITTSELETTLVNSLYTDVFTRSSNYYYFVGKTSTWSVANGGTAGVDGFLNGQNLVVAPDPVDSHRYEYDVRGETIIYKQISAADTSFVIPRYDWVTGLVWDMYDDMIDSNNLSFSGATTLSTSKFYALTLDNNVYKCISNNYDAISTVQPTGTATTQFKTADGYIWKFMYKIPAAVQNKFYTIDSIPVFTALRDKYYNNGVILNAFPIETGSGYTNSVLLQCSGDGYLENNPYALSQNMAVQYGGAGFKPSKTITAASWLASVVTVSFADDHTFVAGDSIIIRHSTNIAYNVEAVVIDTPTTNSLTFAMVSDPGVYSGGALLSLNIVTMSTPTKGATPTLAKGHAHIDATGVITAVELDPVIIEGAVNYGYGYDELASITIAQPLIEDHTWTADTPYLINAVVKYGINYYKVTTGGIGNSTPPTHIDGTTTHGVPYLFIAADANVQVISSKTEVKMTPVVEGGFITSVLVEPGSIGYTYCNVTPVDVPPNTSAIIGVDLSVGDVNTLQSEVELGAVDGSLSHIKLVKDQYGNYQSGSGYGQDTTIEITGDGTGATATPIIVNGAIVDFTITNAGSGYYREANINILTSTGTGCVARSILSPAGGHGKNAIKEFFSKSLMMYSTFSDERINKIQNLNDYRQFGIIRNPLRFGETRRASSNVDTACHVLTSPTTINPIQFAIDDELYQTNGSRFRIVMIENNRMIVQLINKIEPSTNMAYNNNPSRYNNQFEISSIVQPGIDKYSGDILFIENRLPFVISSDQVITFKTVVGFA